MKALILTCKSDPHADSVIDYLNNTRRSADIVRINTEDFANNTKVTFDHSDVLIHVQDSQRDFRCSEITSVWYRRPKQIAFGDHGSKFEQSFRQRQWSHFLFGVYGETRKSARWFNPISTKSWANSKISQINIARLFGFRVPQTLISNEPSKVREFWNSCDEVCVKALANPDFGLSENPVNLWTRVLSEDDKLANDSDISSAPLIYQEFIRKSSDIRVVVVENKIFAVEIDSQSSDDAKVDFRAGDLTTISHREIKLPRELVEKIKKFCNHFNLRFAALDFCRDSKSKEIIFLENNPNGQWLWLERQASVPITQAIAEAIVS
jgi:glutathione synthase/RimK-type ligase-like ATP-grasp enzyme